MLQVPAPDMDRDQSVARDHLEPIRVDLDREDHQAGTLTILMLVLVLDLEDHQEDNMELLLMVELSNCPTKTSKRLVLSAIV